MGGTPKSSIFVWDFPWNNPSSHWGSASYGNSWDSSPHAAPGGSRLQTAPGPMLGTARNDVKLWNNKTWADVQKCHKVSRCFFLSVSVVLAILVLLIFYLNPQLASSLLGPFKIASPWQRGCWNRYPATWADRDPSCAFLQRPPGRSRSSCRTTATLNVEEELGLFTQPGNGWHSYWKLP